MASRMGRAADQADAQEIQKQPHAPLKFLVSPEGYGQEWVCCPACCSKPDGWWPDGTPKYTGGVHEVIIRDGKAAYEAVAACRCAAGQVYHTRKTGPMAFFDQLPPQTEFLRKAPALIWVKGRSQGPPPKSIHPDEIDVGPFLERARGILSQQMTGKIDGRTAERLLREASDEAIGPPHGQFDWPYVLTTPAQKELYGADWPDWKGPRAADVAQAAREARGSVRQIESPPDYHERDAGHDEPL